MQSVELAVAIFTAVLNSYLGLLVYFRNNKSWTNNLFFFLTTVISSYVIVNYLSLHPPQGTAENQLFWIRVVMAVFSFLGPTLFLLVHTFPGEKLKLKVPYLIAILILLTAAVSLSLSPYVFTHMEYPEGQPIPQPGPAIPVIFIDFAGLFVLSFILLIYKYRKSTGVEKVQFFYFLAGIISTFTLMIGTTFISVVVFKYSGLVFLGPSFVLLLVGFVSYAIVRHRFLDIRLIVARSVTYSLLIIIMAGIYTLGFYTISSIIFTNLSQKGEIILSTLLAIIIAFSYQRVRRALEIITDRIFYKDKYDAQALLEKLAHLMASTIDLDTLVNSVLALIMKKMKVAKTAIYLFKKDKIHWQRLYGYETNPLKNQNKIDNVLKTIAVSKNEGKNTSQSLIIFDELPESSFKNLLREADIRVIMPLVVKDDVIGMLMFGEKASGDIYSLDDIDFLEIFDPEFAVAIQNVESFEEIKNFNVTLQKEIKKATQNLKSANEKLKVLDKVKDEFLSIASHELRTPMTAIKSYLWMVLNRNSENLNLKNKEYLNRVYFSTERLINLVNDMLNVSRIESGKIMMKIEEFDVIKLINDVANEVKARMDERKQKLILRVELKSLIVASDREKIHQVLENLIGNSIKFTNEGGEIRVTVKREGKFAQIRVKDNGRGIAKDDIPKLFRKFGRLENSLESISQTSGTGLGLYICQQFIELSGGKIGVVSESGKGAEFFFTLPLTTGKYKNQKQVLVQT